MNIEHIKSELFKHVPYTRTFLKENYEIELTKEETEEAILTFLELKLERLVEAFADIVDTPRLDDHRMFLGLLDRETIFSGNRKFSPEKLKAIVLFFATIVGARSLSKTRLNKLAFYADFRHYSKTGRSISGSSYARLPYGPVIVRYDDFLEELANKDVISIVSEKRGENTGNFIESEDGSWRDILTDDERKTCMEVLREFGKLTAEEISDVSHEEEAWKETPTGELISYAYAEKLKGNG